VSAHPAPARAPRRVSVGALVPIRRSGAGRPFFCVTASYADVLRLARLARAMRPTRPFYALQPPIADGLHPAEGLRVETLIDRYAAEVRRVQPTGPYLLGGLSAGGLMALEIALRLRADGQAVAQLLLLDSPTTVSPFFHSLYRAGHTRARGLFPAARDDEPRLLSILRALFVDEGFQAHLQAARGYQPEPYDGPMVLLAASRSFHGFSFSFPMRWRGVARGRYRAHSVPGNHDTFTLPPHVDGLAGLLDRCLDEAESAL
jgi:thioesterase domain-containing protein